MFQRLNEEEDPMASQSKRPSGDGDAPAGAEGASSGGSGDTPASASAASNSTPPAGAAATADAASSSAAEAAGGPPKKKKGRPRKLAASVVRENNERIAGGIAGLEALHAETLKGIQGETILEKENGSSGTGGHVFLLPVLNGGGRKAGKEGGAGDMPIWTIETP